MENSELIKPIHQNVLTNTVKIKLECGSGGEPLGSVFTHDLLISFNSALGH